MEDKTKDLEQILSDQAKFSDVEVPNFKDVWDEIADSHTTEETMVDGVMAEFSFEDALFQVDGYTHEEALGKLANLVEKAALTDKVINFYMEE